MPKVFISYRRQDTSGGARWLYSTLRTTFGNDAVFMDVESIRASNKWQDLLKENLESSDVVMAVIGPNWLRITDEHYRRRIDRKDDWVREELRYALSSNKKVMPVLMVRAPLPSKDALPEDLAGLADRQAFELRDDRWEQDLRLLIEDLYNLRFRPQGQTTRYPKPKLSLAELAPAALIDALQKLPGWELVTTPLPGSPGLQRTELMKQFEFKSFEAAMRFMADAATFAAETKHHPRWENIWRTVTVWLSTWDIGHKPSELDVRLAKRLDELARDVSSRPGAPSSLLTQNHDP